LTLRREQLGGSLIEMTAPHHGDFDYDNTGHSYARYRQPDPRIAALINARVGPARTVINVGAGAGSYEPADRYVVAVEPSPTMRAQRPHHLPPALAATAQSLPFDDRSFDAAMAMSTIHQWTDMAAGLRELRRVARGPVVVLTFDFDALSRYWLIDYLPELLRTERHRLRPLSEIARQLGGTATIEAVPIPLDCLDGFGEAYYGRPEMYLDADARAAQSLWGFVGVAAAERAVRALEADLTSGAWDERYGHLRAQPSYNGSVTLITAT
jgi:SAM-dependent methyltransferase